MTRVLRAWRHLSADERADVVRMVEGLLSGAEFSRENQTNGYIL